LVGNREVSVMGAAEVSTDAVGHLLGTEQAVRLKNGALAREAVHPLGLDRVEPRALHRQGTRHDADAVPLLLDLAVGGANPGPHPFADMPGGSAARPAPTPAHRLPAPAYRTSPGTAG